LDSIRICFTRLILLSSIVSFSQIQLRIPSIWANLLAINPSSCRQHLAHENHWRHCLHAYKHTYSKVLNSSFFFLCTLSNHAILSYPHDKPWRSNYSVLNFPDLVKFRSLHILFWAILFSYFRVHLLFIRWDNRHALATFSLRWCWIDLRCNSLLRVDHKYLWSNCLRDYVKYQQIS